MAANNACRWAARRDGLVYVGVVSLLLLTLACVPGEPPPSGSADDPLWDTDGLPVFRVYTDEDWEQQLRGLVDGLDDCDRKPYAMVDVVFENPETGGQELYEEVGWRFRGQSAIQNMDLTHERVGFKLGWGCLTFYPYFYAIGLWAVAPLPDPGTPTALLVVYALVFWAGWSLARGANMQKWFFKTAPHRAFLGIAPRVVTDGQRTLLVSGFWGVSRHVNYLGEVLMATGIALAVGYPLSPWPWLYPLYYVLLLVPRERDDDRRCAEKYGTLWDAYRERVRWRIIPGLY